jgi:hypothetical protein
MSRSRTLIVVGVPLLALPLLLASLAGRLSGRTLDEAGPAPAKQTPGPTDTRTETPAVETSASQPSPVDEAAREKAMLAAWQKNIDQWKKEGTEETADNSYCLVCHNNYRREKLVKAHEPVGIGCETCHGISDRHSADEDSVIPPDILFERTKVGLFCVQCHEQDELIESDDCHKKFFAGKLDHDKTCMSCHGSDHELKVRTRRWNKVTRELEWCDGVRMMQQRGDEQAP